MLLLLLLLLLDHIMSLSQSLYSQSFFSYKKWLLSEIDPSGKIFPPGVLDRLASYQDV